MAKGGGLRSWFKEDWVDIGSPKKVRNQIGFMNNGGTVKSFVARGCGAIDPSRTKKTKMRMS